MATNLEFELELSHAVISPEDIAMIGLVGFCCFAVLCLVTPLPRVLANGVVVVFTSCSHQGTLSHCKARQSFHYQRF